MNQVRSEDPVAYLVDHSEDDAIIARAFAIIESRMQRAGTVFDSPNAVKRYLTLFNAQERDQYRERFTVMFLDSQHALISCEVLFEGTLTQTSVYPREVVRRALALNAAAVIVSHNHPSGSLEFSRADEAITQTLKTALSVVDIRVLDHILTCPGAGTRSMAEMGLM